MSPYRDRRVELHAPSPMSIYVARVRFHLAEVVAFVCVLAGLMALLAALNGCVPRTPAQAEAAYTAEQTACVVDCHARHESIACVRACRDASDRKWGLEPRKGSR